MPAGALYAFPDVGVLMEHRGTGSSTELATQLLREYGVASVPGTAFGPRGERHLRFSFAVDEAQMADAMARIVRWGER